MKEQTPYHKQSFWTRFTLRLMWKFTSPDERKPWGEVISGMEPHEHKYTIPVYGGRLMQCEHKGCYMCDDPKLKQLQEQALKLKELQEKADAAIQRWGRK